MKGKAYSNMVLMLMNDLMKEAQAICEQQVADAKNERDLFADDIVNEDIRLAKEECKDNIEEIRSACKEVLALISIYNI